ncbi:hypothetical protein L596_029054 [Steinernema carpocapsae]|uniref:Uncharacterized protein n=1 Tax=Steinernema carpocapsae TaxID=34508 RepID=A0A4V5ZXC9_STECR|nr:hypothetical protein L596_029054 [Steinernema carpocapsae]
MMVFTSYGDCERPHEYLKSACISKRRFWRRILSRSDFEETEINPEEGLECFCSGRETIRRLKNQKLVLWF